MQIALKAKGKTKKKKTGELHSCFAEGAYWKELNPMEATVEEPVNPTFTNARAPTIEERDTEFVPVKYNFEETFDRDVFKGTAVKKAS